jgi:hypothetical protein
MQKHLFQDCINFESRMMELIIRASSLYAVGVPIAIAYVVRSVRREMLLEHLRGGPEDQSDRMDDITACS